jgi:hypothetical protein
LTASLTEQSKLLAESTRSKSGALDLGPPAELRLLESAQDGSRRHPQLDHRHGDPGVPADTHAGQLTAIGLDELEQAPATLRPGDRLPFPVLTLAETTERVQVVVSWKDEAGPHQESFTVQLP